MAQKAALSGQNFQNSTCKCCKLHVRVIMCSLPLVVSEQPCLFQHEQLEPCHYRYKISDLHLMKTKNNKAKNLNEILQKLP